MSPEEIIEAYDVLVQEGNNYAAQEAAKIGNSQASLGLMAERVARPSGQTSGLANYTYNRLLRPTVDTIAANLTTAGLSQGMDRYLKDQLTAAKNAYENAKNRYTVAASGGGGGGGGNGGTDPYKERTFGTGNENPVNQTAYTAAGTVVGTGSTGNGVYDIIVADGKGGSEIYQYYGPSREEALSKYYRDYGGGPASSSSNSGSNGNGVSGGGGGGGGGGGR